MSSFKVYNGSEVLHQISDNTFLLRVLPGSSVSLQPYDLFNSPISSDGAQDTTMNLPSAASLLSFLTAQLADTEHQTFKFQILNYYPSHAITVATNTGVTLSGVSSIPFRTFAEFIAEITDKTLGSEAYSVAGIGGSLSGTVTQVSTGTGLTGGPITTTGTISLANTAVTPGSYTITNLTVDQQGRLTAASNGTAVTSLANTAGAGTGLVVGGPAGSVTIKEIVGGGGLNVTSNATDVTITGTGLSGSGVDKHLARFFGTSSVQNGVVIEDDAGSLTAVTSINNQGAGTYTTVTNGLIAATNNAGTITATSATQETVLGSVIASSQILLLSSTIGAGCLNSNIVTSTTISGNFSGLLSCSMGGALSTLSGLESLAVSVITTSTGALTLSGNRSLVLGADISAAADVVSGTDCLVAGYSQSGAGILTVSGTSNALIGCQNTTATASNLTGIGGVALGCSGAVNTTANFCGVIGSTNSTAGFANTVVLGAISVASGAVNSVCGGTGSGVTATTNRTWQINGADGSYQSAKAAGTYGAAGAAYQAGIVFDFGEYMPNQSPGEVIPYGTILSEEDGYVRAALPGDDMIGVCSSTPAFMCNDSFSHWYGKYQTDVWGLVINIAAGKDDPDPIAAQTGWKPLINPDYDPSKPYTPRAQRAEEWSPVGMMGQINVRLDSTVNKRDYITIDLLVPGRGTKSPTRTGIRCMYIKQKYDDENQYAVGFCRVNCML